MKVLVACEQSGTVRDAFSRAGHDAWSLDVLPCDCPKEDHSGCYHIHSTLQSFLHFESAPSEWDMIIAHPPCTHLASSGARWFKDKQKEQAEAIEFCEWIWDLDCPRIVIENPVGVLSTRSSLGKATQYIQPWQFGHGETKKTGLWIKGLPKLEPTNVVEGREQRVWKLPPSEDRWKLRSKTYEGIANAMAQQWGDVV